MPTDRIFLPVFPPSGNSTFRPWLGISGSARVGGTLCPDLGGGRPDRPDSGGVHSAPVRGTLTLWPDLDHRPLQDLHLKINYFIHKFPALALKILCSWLGHLCVWVSGGPCSKTTKLPNISSEGLRTECATTVVPLVSSSETVLSVKFN